MAKSKFIQTSEHAMIGRAANAAEILAPGERVLVDEESTAHKFLVERIEANDPDYEHLSVVEVDLKAEGEQQKELDEKIAEGKKIAAEARDEQLRALEDRQQELSDEDTPAIQQLEDADPPPQDKEAQRLAKESGAGQRATTQEDVVDEDKESASKRGRRGRQQES